MDARIQVWLQHKILEEENMETPTNTWARHLAWLSIILGMGSLMIIPFLIFFSLFSPPGQAKGWFWIKEHIDALAMFILGSLMAVGCVITAFMSVRREPKLRPAKTAVLVAVLVVLFLLLCNLVILIN